MSVSLALVNVSHYGRATLEIKVGADASGLHAERTESVYAQALTLTLTRADALELYAEIGAAFVLGDRSAG